MKLEWRVLPRTAIGSSLALIFVACCISNGVVEEYFSLPDFDEKIIAPEVVEFSPAVLDRYSSSLQVIGSSVFILSPRSADKLVTCFDFETGDKEMFVSRGRGPQEILGIDDLCVTDDAFYIYDTNERKILRYARSVGNSLLFDSTLVLENYYLHVIPTPDGRFLGLPMNNGRFSFISSDGDYMESRGSFLPVKGPRKAVNNRSLQTLVAFSPDGQHMCSAYKDADCIEFYDHDLNLTRRLMGPEGRIPEVVEVNRAGLHAYASTPNYKEFMGICAMEEGVYVGYVGYERKKGDPDRGLNSILFFDWEGNCKIRYLLPFELDAFDIDADNRLVGVTFDYEHPQLVRFPLP